MITREDWRDIPGYVDYYQVSNTGRVRSVGGIFNGKHQMRPAPRLVAPSPRKGGYLFIGLCKNGARKFYPVSQLVLLAFVGPRPKGQEAAHLDGVRTRNIPSNLMWATPQENIRQRDEVHKTTARGDRHGMRIHKGLVAGEKNGKAKLTLPLVRQIRARYADGTITQQELAAEFNTQEPAIWKIVNNRTWIEGGQSTETERFQ